MSDKLTQQIKLGLYTTISSLTVAAPLSLMAGYSAVGFGKLWVILSLNVFGLPLLLTDQFAFPLWMWYVIVLTWVGKMAVILRYGPD